VAVGIKMPRKQIARTMLRGFVYRAEVRVPLAAFAKAGRLSSANERNDGKLFLRRLEARMLSINFGALVLPLRLRLPAAKQSHHHRRQTPVAFLPKGGQALAQLPPSPALRWLPLTGTTRRRIFVGIRRNAQFVPKSGKIKCGLPERTEASELPLLHTSCRGRTTVQLRTPIAGGDTHSARLTFSTGNNIAGGTSFPPLFRFSKALLQPLQVGTHGDNSHGRIKYLRIECRCLLYVEGGGDRQKNGCRGRNKAA